MSSLSSRQNLRDIILGGQDGIVNVLGVVLGVAAATGSTKLVLVSGLAATFAESISMAAVAFTSQEAQASQYESRFREEQKQVEEDTSSARRDVRGALERWGFSGELLERAVSVLTTDKNAWVKFMMLEEVRMCKDGIRSSGKTALVVGLASLIGSLIPLLAFPFIPNITAAVGISCVLSGLALFGMGFGKARLTIGNPLAEGIKITLIGLGAAATGYAIGYVLSLVNL